jgi:hypothetical protein
MFMQSANDRSPETPLTASKVVVGRLLRPALTAGYRSGPIRKVSGALSINIARYFDAHPGPLAFSWRRRRGAGVFGRPEWSPVERTATRVRYASQRRVLYNIEKYG